MYCSFFRPLRYVTAWLCFMLVCVSAQAQKPPIPPSKPVNPEKGVEEKVVPDRALSYYHFTASKWYEGNGDLPKAMSEMLIALKYSPNSPAVHLEMAELLDRSGNTEEAIKYAEEAARLDPQDPDPHWLLANIYFKSPEQRGMGAKTNLRGSLQKAIDELEKLKELAPTDERIFFALGGAYFEIGEPDKAIQAFEKFQSLSPAVDNGYKEIAKYYGRNGNEEKAIEYLIKGLKIQPDSPESLSLLGSLYLKLGRNKDAVPVYKKLLEVSGNNTSVGRQLAPLLVETGQYDDAINLLDTLIKALPSDKGFPILLGRAQLGLRKMPEAIETFQKAAIADPNSVEPREYLSRAYIESGKFDDAVSTLADLLKIAPSDRPAQTLLARAQIGLRKMPEAIQTLQSIIGADPDAIEAQFYLGVAYAETGKYSEAAKQFTYLLDRTAVHSDEASANRNLFQRNLGAVYEEMGEYDKAIALYQEIAQTDPDANSWILDAYRKSRQLDKGALLGKQLCEKDPNDNQNCTIYAYILADSGKTRDAIEILSKILQANPQNINIYIHLSHVYLQDKRYADAEKILRRAEGQVSDSDSMEKLKFQRATVYERQKDYDRAESLFKEILKSDPKNAQVLNYLGYMLADQGVRLDEAIQYIKDALAIDPYSGAYLDSLGWALFKMNDLENAERYLLQASEIVKFDSTIDDHLGDLYYKIGNLQKANEFWNRSVSIGAEPEDIQKVRKKLDALQETLKKQKSQK